MKIDQNYKPKVRGDVLFRELDDGCILYEAEKGKVHTLNPTAAYIWCMSDGTRSIKEIADGITRGFRPENAKVLEEVIKTVGSFSKKGLLVNYSDVR